MNSEIKIQNASPGVTVLDIEGVIGVPEEWQFDDPAGRVATYRKFRDTVGTISKISSAEVVVNIRSTGGDVGDALLIFDALASLDATITTRCYGYVALAATIIAQAASEGRREISANSLYLIHNAVSNCEGNAGDFRQREQLLTQTDRRIASIYSERSGRDPEVFTILMAENNGSGRWLSPEETLAMGLADRITDAVPVTNEVPMSDYGVPSPQKQKSLSARISALVGFLSGDKPTPRAADSADADSLRWQHETELEQLRQKITSHESENSRLQARPTETKPKEDPAPTESRRSANQSAYQRDAESLFR